MHKDYAAWASRWRVPLGFVLAAGYLILAQPSVVALLFGGAVSLGGLLLRAWSAGYLAKNQRLATCGPYSHTRNPLYLGSALMGLGCVIAGRSWVMGAGFAVLFVLVYCPVMNREARFLQREFPEAFEPYQKQVPLFIPRLSGMPGGSEKFLWRLYLKNREYEAAAGYVAGMVFLAIKMWLR